MANTNYLTLYGLGLHFQKPLASDINSSSSFITLAAAEITTVHRHIRNSQTSKFQGL